MQYTDAASLQQEANGEEKLMHYYQHHIGDFIKDTANLSDHQLATYMRMLWSYYDAELPITGELEDIAFAVRSDEKTVRLLLRHYFKECSGGWHHSRCDREISDYKSKSEKAKRGAEARWINKKAPPPPSDGNADAMQTHSEGDADASNSDANQEPRTNNQSSVPNGTGAEAPVVKSPADMDRDELWSVAKSLLSERGMPAKQCGSFVGKLVKDYTAEVVIEVVRAAVVARPVNVQEFLVGGCRHQAGGRSPKKSTMSGLLPPNSPRIPTPEEANDAWMRDLEPAHV